MENNIWTKPFRFVSDSSESWNFDVYFINNRNEYFLFLPDSLMVFNLINFDGNFSLISQSDSQNSYTRYTVDISECEIVSLSIVYNKNKNKGFASCSENYGEYDLNIFEVEYNNLSSTVFEKFDILEILQSLPTSIINPETTNIFSSISSSYKENHLFDIIFNKDGYIFKGEIKEKKEDIENKLDEIMNIIEIKEKYIIFGEDYNITITNNNNNDELLKTVYVDLKECEEILRNEYKIPPSEILILPNWNK